VITPPDHAFPETGGFLTSREDTKTAAIEFTRTRNQAAG